MRARRSVERVRGDPHDPAPRSRRAEDLTAADVPVTLGMLGQLRTELIERIDQAREAAKADAQRLDTKIDSVKAERLSTGMSAQMARIALLVSRPPSSSLDPSERKITDPMRPGAPPGMKIP